MSSAGPAVENTRSDFRRKSAGLSMLVVGPTDAIPATAGMMHAAYCARTAAPEAPLSRATTSCHGQAPDVPLVRR